MALSMAHKPHLTTDRLRIEPLGPAHVDGMMQLCGDALVSRLTGSHATFTRVQIERHCATRGGLDGRLDFAILDRGDGSFLGDLAMLDLDPHNRSCSFRIALLSTAMGQGYGPEATRRVVDYVFDLGVHRIGLDVYAFNPRARRAYEKVGFVHEGTQRSALLWDGEWVDSHIMSILATDRDAQSKGRSS